MNGTGEVVALHTAPESSAPTEARETVEVVTGKGVRGDRKFREDGAGRGAALTLIEAEAVEAVAREYDVDVSLADHRRNVTTRDAALNHLVGERFRVGDVLCEGVLLCEPCTHLESLTEAGVREAFVHRGGLRADVLEGGRIRVGDTVEPL
jgi:MOSC domain-containing protein YiiM